MLSVVSASLAWGDRLPGSVGSVGNFDANDIGPPASASGKLRPLVTMAVSFPNWLPTLPPPTCSASFRAVSNRVVPAMRLTTSLGLPGADDAVFLNCVSTAVPMAAVPPRSVTVLTCSALSASRVGWGIDPGAVSRIGPILAPAR